MTTTYVLKSANSDLTGGAEWNKELSTGTESPSTVSETCGSGVTEDSYGYTVANNPSSSGATGNYTVEMNVTSGSTDMQLSVAVARVNSSGVQQQISSYASEQQGTAGVKTFTLTSINLGTWASGDRLRVNYRFRSTAAHGNTTVSIETGTTDAEVVAPWTLATTYLISLAATEGSTITVAKPATFPKTFVLTESGVMALAKLLSLLKSMSVTETGVLTLTKGIVYQKSATVTETGVMSLAKIQNFVKVLSATEPSSVTLSMLLSWAKSMNVTSADIASLSKATSLHLSLTVTEVSALSLAFGKIIQQSLPATETSVAELVLAYTQGLVAGGRRAWRRFYRAKDYKQIVHLGWDIDWRKFTYELPVVGAVTNRAIFTVEALGIISNRFSANIPLDGTIMNGVSYSIELDGRVRNLVKEVVIPYSKFVKLVSDKPRLVRIKR